MLSCKFCKTFNNNFLTKRFKPTPPRPKFRPTPLMLFLWPTPTFYGPTPSPPPMNPRTHATHTPSHPCHPCYLADSEIHPTWGGHFYSFKEVIFFGGGRGGQYPIACHGYFFNSFFRLYFNPCTSCKHTRKFFLLNHIFITIFLNSIEFPRICAPFVKKRSFFNKIKG